ncbi:non-hydrolyzing UDP-N-acetylglucosamine 2-epimerase [Shewanella atlantica]|uniref:non-hydrolyzing UDP-N-acetylglucosamine 2-epimerase n=1 Tax=Shewanella atlantica TaxID=271099 RepID=UPI003734D8BF
MKILTVIGARPQFIKAATVSRVIDTMDNVTEVIVHTGQHFDANMSDIFFEQMEIPKPDYNLEISSLSHGAMTGRQLEAIERVLLEEKPDWVIVYGDTNSTLAGALAASKLHIKVAHVEAGLRSFNMKMPEEQNRIVTDRLSTILFCPTQTALDNLNNEGYTNLDIETVVSGDVMYDAALFYKQFSSMPEQLNNLDLSNGFVLSTIHRAENTDDPARLSELVDSLNELHKSTPVVMPLHPRTKKKLSDLGLTLNIHLIDPVGYLEMVYLLDNCSFVASDSGGVQKEAYFFGKQCLILRDETEWVELVKCGSNKIVGANKQLILEEASKISCNSKFNEKFYGDGKSAEGIVNSLIEFVNV